MNIKIISVGKMKEKYLINAVEEYSKRIKRFCKLEFIEVKDEHAPENISFKDSENIKEKEGHKILSKIKNNEYVILLELKGNALDSESFAKKIDELGVYGNSNITFVIGGSLGNSKNVINRADFLISFSKMTFPHQLIKVFLVEQIFRSFKINRNETYHK